MRTLKRTLCLVLALVMCLGFFGIASAAGYSDSAKIQYKEAVDFMSGIGSINGMGDGNFNPGGAVTRAQAAKMVAYAVLGETVAKTLPVTASSFKDVDANYAWATPSIEYLVKQGVINGRDSKTFDPQGSVTAFEIAKMLLCAAGYGKNGEYVGASWSLNVAIDAQKLGVFTGTKASDLGKAATREECALYCFNGVTGIELVAYSKDKSIYAPADGTTTIDNTVATSVYKVKTHSGVLTANQANSTQAYTTIGGKDFNITTGLDLVGHYVTVYYKSEYTADVPGVAYSVSDLSTVVTVAKDISSTTAWAAAFGTGTITKTDTATISFTNYAAATPAAITGLTIGSAAKAGTYILYKGDVKSYLATTPYSVDTVVSYTAPTATAKGSLVLAGQTIEIPKTGDAAANAAFAYSIYATPAAKDVVTIQDTGARKTIAKATTATGKVTAVDLTATPNTLTAGGKTYSKSAAFVAPSGFVDFTAAALLNNDCTFFLASDGTVVMAKVNDTAVDAGLVYVVDSYSEVVTGSYGVTTTLVKTQCVDMTGKEVIYTYGVETNTTTNPVLTAADAFNGFLCKVTTAYNTTLKTDVVVSYTKAANTTAVSDSTTYGLKATTAADGAIAATASKIANSNYYTADTQFLFVTGTGATGDLKITKATGAQTIAGNTTYSFYSTKAAADTNYTVKYVVVAAQPAAVSSTSLMFVPQAFTTSSAVSYTDAAGAPAIAYKNIAFVDGAPNTSVLVTDTEAGTITTPGFYSFTKNAAGIYDLSAYQTNVGFGRVTNVYGSLASISGLGDGTAMTNPGSVTDVSAANAKIVDVLYLKDQLLNGGASGLTNHTTLASLEGTVVFYSYTVANGVKTINCIYYVADSSIVVSTQPTALTAAGSLTAAGVNALTKNTTGISYQWKFCATENGTFANDNNAGNNTATLTITDNTDNGYYYCVISNALTGETVNTKTVQVTIA